MEFERDEDLTLKGREATSYYVEDGLRLVWYEETETEAAILDIQWDADGPYGDLDDASPEEFEDRIREILGELMKGAGNAEDIAFELISYEEIEEEVEGDEEGDDEDEGFTGCKLPS